MSSKDSITAILNENKEKIDRIIEDWLPRTFDKDTLNRLCGEPRYAYDIDSATEAIAKPIWEILDRGGKRWRPTLLLLISEALGKSAEDVKDFVVLCEVIHNGTLVIDDIEDASEVRRGGPCLHLMFGVDVAVNAGNAMYYLPTVVLRELRGKLPAETLISAYEIYCREMLNLHFGQGYDIWWHNGKKNPSPDEYLQMCAYKTGTLARLSAKLASLLAGANTEQVEAIGKFAETIGVAFQIQDDILNIVPGKVARTKGQLGEDIHEGKRTLMVLHCLETAAEDKAKRLEEILNSHPEDQAIIDEAIEIIKANGSIEFAQQRGRDLIKSAWEDVAGVLDDSPAKEKLKAFADFLMERDV